MNGKRRTCRTCRWAWGHFRHVKVTLKCYGSTSRAQCWHTKITLGYCRSILKFVRPKRGPTWSLTGSEIKLYSSTYVKIYGRAIENIPCIKLSVAGKPVRSSDTRLRSCSGIGRSICWKFIEEQLKTHTFYQAVRGEETASLERHSLTLVLRNWSK